LTAPRELPVDEVDPGGGWRRGVGLLAGAACWTLALPPVSYAFLAWLSPLFLLAGIEGLGGRARVAGGALAGAALGAMLAGVREVHAGLFLLHMIEGAALLGAWGLLCAPASVGDGKSPRRWLLLPGAAFTALQYARFELLPVPWAVHGPASTVPRLAGELLLPLAGAYGIEFLMFFWATMFLHVTSAMERTRGAKAAVALLACVSLVGLPGWGRRAVPVAGGPELVLVQPAGGNARAADLTLANVSGRALPALVVWPLDITLAEPREEMGGELAAKLMLSARLASGGLVFGAPGVFDDRHLEERRPAVHLMGRDGLLAASAQGLRPNFFLDGLLPERVPLVAQVTGADSFAVAAMTATTLDSQRFARMASRMGAEVLVATAHGRSDDSPAQVDAREALLRVRAAEVGLPLACAAPFGPTVAVEPSGRVIGKAERGRAQVLRVRLPLGGRRTPYTRLGWMIGPASILFMVVEAATGFLRAREWERRREKAENEGLGSDNGGEPPSDRLDD
jgi:apolipoprotein N-acyltransferase